MNQQPSPFLQFDDFLSAEAVEKLLTFVREHETDLAPSSVLTSGERDEDPIRRSQTLFDLDTVWPLFETQLTGLLPAMRKELNVEHFHLDHTERQLTVHFDGDFFGPHNDNGGAEVASRSLTYVYYFNVEPRGFEGGDLWIYDWFDQDGMAMQGTNHQVVEPRHNSIVFFPSWVHHEVRPVKTLAEGLDGCRMTFNGWYHNAAVETPPVIESDPDRVVELLRQRLPTFTEDGFAVVETPKAIHDALAQVYSDGLTGAYDETSDPVYLTAGNPRFIDIGNLGYEIGAELKETHEAWARIPLELSAAYGIRTYRRGNKLRRHVDRFETHVISSVVHIDHEAEVPWALTVEDHHGVVHEVCLEPGQMLLYESAVCAHARPVPFEGDHYGSLFLHYKPVTGWNFTKDEVLTH